MHLHVDVVIVTEVNVVSCFSQQISIEGGRRKAARPNAPRFSKSLADTLNKLTFYWHLDRDGTLE